VKAPLRGMKNSWTIPSGRRENSSFVPEWTGKEAAVKTIFNFYAKLVYPNFGIGTLAEISVERLSNTQDFFLAKGIIQRKSPLEELYTNQFVNAGVRRKLELVG
jgi:NitT/TauT family transport system substrate-binding protein